MTSSSNVRSAVRIWVEPSYSRFTPVDKNRIDLGIIEVSTPFVLSSSVSPISLCSTSDNCNAQGATPIVSGYGLTDPSNQNSIVTNLRYAPLLAPSQSACESKWNTNFQCSSCFPVRNVCAGSNPTGSGTDSCFGDSGGPLAQDFGTISNPSWKLSGVVSTGTTPSGSSPLCGGNGEYGVYVSVAQNRAWIDAVVAGQLNSSSIDASCVAAQTCAGALLAMGSSAAVLLAMIVLLF